MSRTEFTVDRPEGPCACTLATPDTEGRWPAVIVYPDAGGAREAIWGMADRIAADGYAALVPDPSYRAGGYEPFDFTTAFTDPDERKRLFALMATLTNDAVLSDVAALVDALAERPEAAPGTKVGTTGYCMGGRMSLLTAVARPDRVGAAASFHGGRLAVADDPNSPHLLVGPVEAVVLVAAAKEDGSFTAEQGELLDQALTAAGVEHTIDFYDAHHGFAVPDNPTYDEAAARRHDDALSALYSRTLHG
jgi:carboxymethylenebutenolidase